MHFAFKCILSKKAVAFNLSGNDHSIKSAISLQASQALSAIRSVMVKAQN